MLQLNPKEYGKIVSEINNVYSLYKNKRYCIHYSVSPDGEYFLYVFLNYGFNNYEIISKKKF